jgi:hypothetical protein
MSKADGRPGGATYVGPGDRKKVERLALSYFRKTYRTEGAILRVDSLPETKEEAHNFSDCQP